MACWNITNSVISINCNAANGPAFRSITFLKDGTNIPGVTCSQNGGEIEGATVATSDIVVTALVAGQANPVKRVLRSTETNWPMRHFDGAMIGVTGIFVQPDGRWRVHLSAALDTGVTQRDWVEDINRTAAYIANAPLLR